MGKAEARSALDAVREKMSKRIAPRLARPRAVKGSARETRAEAAVLSETVGELAEQAAEAKRAVKAACAR